MKDVHADNEGTCKVVSDNTTTTTRSRRQKGIRDSEGVREDVRGRARGRA